MRSVFFGAGIAMTVTVVACGRGEEPRAPADAIPEATDVVSGKVDTAWPPADAVGLTPSMRSLSAAAPRAALDFSYSAWARRWSFWAMICSPWSISARSKSALATS